MDFVNRKIVDAKRNTIQGREYKIAKDTKYVFNAVFKSCTLSFTLLSWSPCF